MALAIGSPAYALIDLDGDGLSDAWVAAYSPAGSSTLRPSEDPDGDGFNNLAESAAGTNPRDGNSRPGALSSSVSGNTARAEWATVPGKTYRLQVSTDRNSWFTLADNLVGDGSSFSRSYALDQTFERGPFPVRRWENLASNATSITGIKNLWSNNTAPTTIRYLDTLALAPSSPNADRFGHYVWGWIRPPQTGNYKFSVASDDQSEFWLSTDAWFGNKSRIAQVDSWTNHRQWDKFSNQTSGDRYLVAGRSYYFEFYHVEGNGGDHFAVAWSGPGLTDREILSSQYLVLSPDSLATRSARDGGVYFRIETGDADTNNDGVSDSDEYFLAVATARRDSQGFTPPSEIPPPVPTGTPTRAEASRFLSQASFGPSTASIDDVRARGYSGWIDRQLGLPATYHFPYYTQRRAEFALLYPYLLYPGWQSPRQEAWWQHALTADDQLRQRMAFALSQIFVVSQEGALEPNHKEVCLYYDMLLENAFGNFRTLLGKVTKSPVMGVYLSMIRNRAADLTTGQRPDENYAREVMQLFTIGLNELNPDGSLKRDTNNKPIPTYTQAHIADLARVFTGWGPFFNTSNPPRWNDGTNRLAPRLDWFFWGSDMENPMTYYPEYHDSGSKNLVNGLFIPAGTDGATEMERALDHLFNHPNVGPFISRQLIQRFVTSNPSNAYVYRVAQVFENNGAGVRGDLGAVLRAILMDYEARVSSSLDGYADGKRREPVLRLTHYFRAFPPAITNPLLNESRLFINFQFVLPQQVPQNSPSVFNFFQPGYAAPGAVASAGLVSPEFQINSETTVINEANNIHQITFWQWWVDKFSLLGQMRLQAGFDAEIALLERSGYSNTENQRAMVDLLAEKLLTRPMSDALRANLMNTFSSVSDWFNYPADYLTMRNRRRELAAMAAYVIAVSPEYVIQK